MPLYENSVIYKLVHKNDQDNENIYVGSTTNFRLRKSKHKNSCNDEKAKEYNRSLYQFIRENGGWDEWQMIAIENHPCESKRDLEIRERFHIETLKSKLNRIVPTRTREEYMKDNIEKIREYDRNRPNKDERNENNKKYVMKKYNNDPDFRDKHLEQQREKVSCECGCILSRNHLSRHRKSDKHKKKMEELNK